MESSKPPKLYFLVKRGLYYRPKSAGYTPHILGAGVYGEEEAKFYRENPDADVRVIDLEHKKGEIFHAYKQATALVKHLTEQGIFMRDEFDG